MLVCRRRGPMMAQENLAGPGALRPSALGSAIRAITLGLSTLTMGLIAGVYYAFGVSVNLGMARQPDATYVAAMNAINDRIENPLFFFSSFGAALFPLAMLACYYRRPRGARFRLVLLASVLYFGGSFLLTSFVSVPMNEALAHVGRGASTAELARARADYEGPWDFWNWVRTAFSALAFLALIGACLLRDDRV